MCIRPLHYFKSDIEIEPGKFDGFITGYQKETANYNDFLAYGVKSTLGYIADFIPVPCGKCYECKKAIQYRWVGRCIAEMLVTPFTYFITLTFDDLHLKDVSKRDIQLFIKRFRKKIKCRYLAVGEYGSISNRPHYHLILFCQEELKDLEIMKRGNYPLYKSDFLSSIWKYGYSSVGIANAATISYTIGYLISQEKKTAFKLQSQGLGAEFFKDLKERYIVPSGQGKEIIVGLPRYLKAKHNLDFGFDKSPIQLAWKNELAVSGMSDRIYRQYKEYIAAHKFNY